MCISIEWNFSQIVKNSNIINYLDNYRLSFDKRPSFIN